MTKIKIDIDCDERYPDYSFRRVTKKTAYVTSETSVVEVTPRTLARWRRIVREYEKLQAELKGLLP